MTAFNITSLSLSETTTVHLKGPDGSFLYADKEEKLPLEIEVYGRSSKQMRNYLAASERKKAKRNKNAVLTPEQAQEDNADFFAAITKSVNNFDIGNGPLKTAEDFKELYMMPALYFIYDQVSETLGDTESFMQR